VSEDRLDFVRRAYDAISSVGRTEREGLDPEEVDRDVWDRIDPDMELHERADLPDAKVYRGREEAKEFWRKTSDVFSEIRWEIRELIDLGDAIVVDSRIVATGRGSDVPVELDEYDVFWFRDDLIVRLQAFGTMDEAMAAARAG
jgi:ketosteroid isomerase-like protein